MKLSRNENEKILRDDALSATMNRRMAQALDEAFNFFLLFWDLNRCDVYQGARSENKLSSHLVQTAKSLRWIELCAK